MFELESSNAISAFIRPIPESKNKLKFKSWQHTLLLQWNLQKRNETAICTWWCTVDLLWRICCGRRSWRGIKIIFHCLWKEASVIGYQSIGHLEWSIEVRHKDNHSSLPSLEICLKQKVITESRIINRYRGTEVNSDHALHKVLDISQVNDGVNLKLSLIIEDLCESQVIHLNTLVLWSIKELELCLTHSHHLFNRILSVLGKIFIGNFHLWNASKFQNTLAEPTIVPKIPIPS